MTLIPLADAASLAGVSLTTIRNYIREKRLVGYQKSGRLTVERDEILSVFGAKPLIPHKAGETARTVATLLHLSAVGVVDDVFKVDVAGGRWPHAQNLVRAHTKVAVRQKAVLRGIEAQATTGVV